MGGTDPWGSDRDQDLLEGGDERGSWLGGGSSTPLSQLAAAYARRHPGIVSAVTVAVLVVVGSVAWLHRSQAVPTPVTHLTASAPQSPDDVTTPLWSADEAGRPATRVTVVLPVRLTDPGHRAGSPQVVPIGLAGPGVTDSDAFPSVTLGTAPALIELSAQFDCDKVTLPADPGKYAARVRVLQGAQTAETTSSLGSAGDVLAQRLLVGCGTWLAARDVTIVNVRSQVDPVQPLIQLYLQVHNTGDREVRVWNQADQQSGLTVTNVVLIVPPGGSVTAQLSVRLTTCWSWDDRQLPVTATETPAQLLAAVGAERNFDPGVLPQDPSAGVVLNQQAAQQLKDAAVQACGGITSPAMLTDANHTSYNPRTRVLTVRALVDLPPGVPMTAQLLSAPGGDPGEARPRFTATAPVTPDASGQAAFTLGFTVPPDVVCRGGGPFLALTLVAHVPQGSVTREARFLVTAETFLPDAQRAAACDRRS